MKIEPENKAFHVVFWWVIPCRAISGVFRELAELPGLSVTVVCEGGLTEERKLLGWQEPEFGKAAQINLPRNNWKSKIHRILNENRDAVHVFNSVHTYRKIRFALKKSISLGIRSAVMTESLNNAFCGLKWFVKEIYSRVFIPLRTKSIARKCIFILCLSGSSENAVSSLMRLGWPEEKLFPFGYFSEQLTDNQAEQCTHRKNRETQILCTGYLKRNKGQHILLRALAKLKGRCGHFHCSITGYGPEEKKLLRLSKSLGLDSHVTFKGVLSDRELDALKKNSDIFVAPGLSEPWGIRVNEAIQSGHAVVMSDGIGACELVKVCDCGEVFESGDHDQLSEGLFKLITNPVQLKMCMDNSLNYREKIHPRAAAGYLNQVLNFTLGLEKTKPQAPWL